MPLEPDVAIVLTVHHEGRTLIPTVRALDRAIASAAPLSVEVVIVCDRIDEATRRTLARLGTDYALANAAAIAMLEVDNGDLSASRNDGISATRAPVIGVLDADNLPSENWISRAFDALAHTSEPAIVHPELVVTFGSKRETWRLIGTDDPAFQPGWLAWFNPGMPLPWPTEACSSGSPTVRRRRVVASVRRTGHGTATPWRQVSFT
ncbi:glycosyltransferase family A protein [Microbacterium suwonense]|uniref:Glycosyltransferase 2-like domain-containing protein n=1 Tax=Microbacterium suwonense TaxID=683047 RepID=A0ABM8FTK3_9MICO|nr:glycosyltransferase family A protein [Microbacterium suwonense]BDZ38785.1 hypothetical protein GCM10025863_13990 [Microbacterium suwonense]